MAESLKFGAARYRLWGSEVDAVEGATTAMSVLREFHGHPEGTYGADEILAGKNPSRGTELCDKVEMMYSLAWNFASLGYTDYGYATNETAVTLLETVERVALNAFPGTMTPTSWEHQYDRTSLCVCE